MTTAYLSLGSNIGDRIKNLKNAIKSLSLLPGCNIECVSSVYETAPVGFTKQPQFYNAAVKINTDMTARCLLGACLGIEAGMGRVRTIKNGPRIIDIDILLYGNEKYTDEELTIPHKEMYKRAFVLIPLSEILSDVDLGVLTAEDRASVRRLEPILIKE